jgi:hypothetical protein
MHKTVNRLAILKTLLPILINKIKLKTTTTYINNSNELVWKWDTLKIYNTSDTLMYRLIKTFDTNGNVLTYLTENWLNNTWVNISKETYTYDAKSKI